MSFWSVLFYQWHKHLLVELALAERDSEKASVFFFRRSVAKRKACFQAFLTETVETGGKNRDDFHCMQMSLVMSMRLIRNCKIEWLRTTTTVKHDSTHDQNHVTDHFSCVLLRIRWVVELFRVVATTENILLAFCRLVNSRISSFRKKSFQFTCFKWEGSEICKLCLISAQIYAFICIFI